MGILLKNMSFKDFRTALHRAAYYGEIDVAKSLVEHGANLEVKDNDGW